MWHDLDWVLSLRHPWLTEGLTAFSWLGTYRSYILIVLPLAYWAWQRPQAMRLAMVVLGAALINAVLKDAFQDSRPDIAYVVGKASRSYGVPSGHTQLAFVACLWVAWEVRERWAWAVALALGVLMAFGRMYLGAHDLEDVTVGASVGAVSVAVFALAVVKLGDRWSRLPPAGAMAVVVLAQLVLYLVWPSHEGHPMQGAFGGVMSGWYGGYLLARRLQVAQPASVARRLASSAVGCLALYGLMRAILAAMTAWPDLNPFAFDYVAFALLGWVTTFVLPWLFCTLWLAPRHL